MADLLRAAVKIVMCHLVGDYVFQSNYIATTKGSNWYHMFVHCVLYCVPFAIAFGMDWRLAVIFVSHCIIDPLKARYSKITYMQDQICHYAIIAGKGSYIAREGGSELEPPSFSVKSLFMLSSWMSAWTKPQPIGLSSWYRYRSG